MNGQTQNKQHSINNKQVNNEKKKNCHEDTIPKVFGIGSLWLKLLFGGDSTIKQ